MQRLTKDASHEMRERSDNIAIPADQMRTTGRKQPNGWTRGNGLPVQAMRDGKSYVYFIGAADAGPVKIGVSRAPMERLASLQIGNWVPLCILAQVEGDRELERAYRERFAACWCAGEWHERTPELQAEIDRLNAICPPPVRKDPFKAWADEFASATV